jgi:hypothetical protein
MSLLAEPKRYSCSKVRKKKRKDGKDNSLIFAIRLVELIHQNAAAGL